MRGINQGLMLGTLVRTPLVREVPVAGRTQLLTVALMTIAMSQTRPNGTENVQYLPVTVLGPQAKNLVERIAKSEGPVVLVGRYEVEQERWEDKDTKEDRSRLDAKLLHVEIADGDFSFRTDVKGNLILEGGMNDITVGGNTTGAVDVRYAPNGDKVAEVGVALNQVYKKDGKQEEKVTYIRVVAWRELADELAALPTGSPVIVDGSLMYEHWKDKKSGDDRSTLKVEAQRIVCVARPGTATRAPASITAASVPDQAAKAARIPDTVPGSDVPEEEDLPF